MIWKIIVNIQQKSTFKPIIYVDKMKGDYYMRIAIDGMGGDNAPVAVIDDVLDISEIVETSIISTLPIKRVCKEDCKGLCQECGCNLNYNTCSCNKEDVDIRFESLRGLFDNKEV